MKELYQKNILITGGTGSFGLALTKCLLQDVPEIQSLTIFSRDEYKQHLMRNRYASSHFPHLKFILGDIRDEEALMQATRNMDIVIHAAALKQNINGETYSDEFIKTNVEGSRNLIKACLHQKVKQVISLSTDKAVYPTTLYGASKLCAEKLFLAANTDQEDDTLFSILRLGNLFGSRGSISSELKEKIQHNGIQITDPEMTRFSLTLEESVTLSLEVMREMKGGEIFVPAMKAYQLNELIMAEDENIKIKAVGPRLTEKLHEIALSSEEARFTVLWDKFYVLVSPESPNYPYWQQKGEALPAGFEYNSQKVEQLKREELKALLQTYSS